MAISNFKLAKLSKQEAEKVCEGQRGKPHFNNLTTSLSSDLALAVEVTSENCISKVQEVGALIQQKFGSDQAKPGVVFSESAALAAKEC